MGEPDVGSCCWLIWLLVGWFIVPIVIPVGRVVILPLWLTPDDYPLVAQLVQTLPLPRFPHSPFIY